MPVAASTLGSLPKKKEAAIGGGQLVDNAGCCTHFGRISIAFGSF